MKIGLVCQSCDRRTGIGRIVNALAGEFIGLGHHVSCAAQQFEEVDEQVVKRQIPRFLFSKGLSKALFRRQRFAFKRNEVDISHSFGVGRGSQVVSAQSCHRAGMIQLNELRRDFVERRGFGLYDWVSLSDERSLLTSPTTRRIVSVSHLVKAQVQQEYGVDPALVSVIPNGVDSKRFEKLRNTVDRSELRSRIGLSPDDFVLLFVGNEFGRKGLHVLIRALGALARKDLHLLVVGGGEQKPYKQLASELGIAKRTHFVGNVADPESMFIVADMFVLPSLYEPFGIAVLEAMAAGVPVVTSQSAGVVEGMTHMKHFVGLTNPASLDELVEAIRLIARDDSLRRRLRSEGMEKAEEFSWDRIAQKMVTVYDEVRATL